jgi:ribosome-associated heat shock protein Hsp15
MLKSDHQRIDRWLWHARVVRTRNDAAELVAKGRVRLNGTRETSPGHGVKAGDVLTVALDARVLVLKVVTFSERRGDAQAARHLYEDSTVSGDLQRHSG